MLTLYKDCTNDSKKESTKTSDDKKVSVKSRTPSKSVKKKLINESKTPAEPIAIPTAAKTPTTPLTTTANNIIYSSLSTIDSIIESTVKSSVLLSENKELLDIETDRMIEDICSKPIRRRSSQSSKYWI